MKKPDQRFPKSIRLRTQAEFDSVYNDNHFAADQTLVIKATGNTLGTTRLGLSIGRKVGIAVVRNRWKRLIREAFRRQKSSLPCSWDIVVRPRKGALCEYGRVASSLKILLDRIDRQRRKAKTQNPANT